MALPPPGGDATSRPGMAHDLYRDDFVAWTRIQADLLRRLARGERVDVVDWGNTVEEVESLGRSETKAARSLLTQAILHALKAARWPDSEAAGQWREEALNLLDQARDDFLPSMARNLDLAACFAKARERTLRAPVPGPAEHIPETTSLSLAEVMDRSVELEALVDALGRGGR